jgi:hypothetical protein
MNIVLSFNPVDYSERKRKSVQDEAIKAFSRVSKRVFPVAFGFRGEEPYPLLNSLGIPSLNILRRDSKKELGNDRGLPYIKDIFDYCSKIDCDIFGYVNSDIFIGKDVIDVLNQNYDAYIFSRYEIVDIDCDGFLDSFDGDSKIKKVWGGDKHEGRDAFFFKKEWWLNNHNRFPSSLVLGETEWDTVYRFMIMHGSKFFNQPPAYIDKRILYHPLHNSSWNNKSNGAINNIKIWNEIKSKIGDINLEK